MASDDRLPPRLRETAGSIVGDLTGSTPVEVLHIPRGAMTWKFDVATGSAERFIVRFYPPGREGVVDYEPDLLRRCSSLGAPVPSVVADARSGPSSKHPYVVYRRIEGLSLADHWEHLSEPRRADLCVQIKEALEALHSLDIDGWGELVTSTSARDTSWSELASRALDVGLSASRRSGALSSDLLADLARVRDRLDRFAAPTRGGLVWADVKPDNILVNERGDLAGLLDFESCIGGELCANLGYCFASHAGTSFFEALSRAWAPAPGEEPARPELYAVVRAMLIAQFAAKEDPLPGGLRRRTVEDFLPGLRPAVERLRQRLRDCS